MSKAEGSSVNDDGAVLEGSATGASKGVVETKAQVPKGKQPETPVVKDYSSRIVFAVLLIFVGVVFLLNNFGVVSWSVWTSLLRFWPIFLILIGVQIILGKSKLGSLILGLVTLLLVGAIALIVFFPNSFGVNLESFGFWGSPEAQSEHFEISEDRYEGLVERNVTLDIGEGQFSVEDQDSGPLFNVDSTYYFEEQQPEVTERQVKDRLDIAFGTKGGIRIFGISPNGPQYDFVIGQKDIETSFDVDLGAGEGTFVCENLKMKSVEIELGSGSFSWQSGDEVVIDGRYSLTVGAGRAEVTFGDGLPTGGVSIDVGAGSVYLDLPDNVVFKVDYNVGAGVLKVNGDDYHGDATYQADGYDSAENKLDITVSIGAGKVEIRKIIPQ